MSVVSHKLLYQAGFIRESTAGHYYLLPLGLRVTNKIIGIIREEMNKAGGQELLSPVMHPIELWKETNRNKQAGFELIIVKDRRDTEYALGGTAEEMMVDLVRKFQISYKDLPFNIYQFSTKFRDELRVRGGLLRVREFTMKDAYSFHANEEDFKIEYQNMRDIYIRIFKRLGYDTTVVESDNGYIGGDYCHEFVVESSAGESTYFTTKSGSYAAHEDIAVFKKEQKNLDEKEKTMEEVAARRGTTMEDGVKLHNMPLWQQIKDVLYVDEQGRFILAIIRGDFNVNEVKLKHLTKSIQLRHATDEEIKSVIHSEPGFISPVGIKDIMEKGTNLIIVADESLRTIKNAYGGANKKHRDMLNMNIDRDYTPDIEGDIALAKEGYQTKDGEQLIAKRGIEVGNIFQLGHHYTNLMKNAVFKDTNGTSIPYYMGCYGIGVGRNMATIVEKYHDDKGIMWPKEVAPFDAHLIEIRNPKSEIRKKTEEVYKKLTASGIEILWDDREDVSAGAKFADADLIGIPVRLVISEKTGDKVEWKERGSEKTELISIEEVVKRLAK